MRKIFSFFWVAVFMIVCSMATTVQAQQMYPSTLENGNLVCVDGHMGVGTYADRTSVVVQRYDPPNYQIAINLVYVTFDESYFRSAGGTYVGAPYYISGTTTSHFRYNWNNKFISFLNRNGVWRDWNINKDNSHADGDPLVPHAAEVAFVSAYNIKFFGNKKGYSPILKKEYRVISDEFYRTLGVQ